MEYDQPIQISTNRCKLWTGYYFQHKNTSNEAISIDRSVEKHIEPFGNLLDNIFSNSYRLFTKILEKN
jgi:hypothetical protein